MNTAAVRDPSLLTRLAERFGSQCVVLAVDGKRTRDSAGTMRMFVTTHGGRKVTEKTVAGWAAEAAAAGAGEILLTSVDADGTKEGFDLEMLRAVRGAVDVPIVASGGAGGPDDFARAVLIGGADAVLAASIFHDRVFTIGEVKAAMQRAGLAVRPVPPAPPRCSRGSTRTGSCPSSCATSRRETSSRSPGRTPRRSRRPARRASRTSTAARARRSGRRARRRATSRTSSRSRSTATATRCSTTCNPSGPPATPGRGRASPSVGHARARRRATPGGLDLTALFATIADRRDNPDAGSYTNRLLAAGPARIAQKVGEEAVEAALAAVGGTDEALANEAADLLYHLAVLLTARGLAPKDVAAVLEKRRGAPRRGTP